MTIRIAGPWIIDSEMNRRYRVSFQDDRGLTSTKIQPTNDPIKTAAEIWQSSKNPLLYEIFVITGNYISIGIERESYVSIEFAIKICDQYLLQNDWIFIKNEYACMI